jgi:hypothetical protein
MKMSLTQLINERFSTNDLGMACRELVNLFAPKVQGASQAIDVVALARDLGVRVEQGPDFNFEGRFSWEYGDEIISVASGGNPTRARFTLAHELGHWMIRQIVKTERGERFRASATDVSPVSDEERIANIIAAEILLPLRAVRTAIANERITCALVQNLASRFKASRQAVLRRITDLLNTSLLHVVAIPHRFRNLQSTALVDSATCLRPFEGLLFDHIQTRFASRVPFSHLVESSDLRITVISPWGRVNHHFSVARRQKPVPHAELLATDVVFVPVLDSNVTKIRKEPLHG